MRPRLTPSLTVSLAALFFALGGSAYALVDAARPQPSCAAGAVRGVAAVTGESGKGIANVGGEFTSRPGVFAQAFNCVGGRPQVRRLATGVYEVRFPGNGAKGALVSGKVETTIEDVGASTFRVYLWVAGRQDAVDAPFTVVLT